MRFVTLAALALFAAPALAQDDLRAQIQKKYDARLEKAFKLVAGKQEDRIAALRAKLSAWMQQQGDAGKPEP